VIALEPVVSYHLLHTRPLTDLYFLPDALVTASSGFAKIWYHAFTCFTLFIYMIIITYIFVAFFLARDRPKPKLDVKGEDAKEGEKEK
jgi:hypothetical protein